MMLWSLSSGKVCSPSVDASTGFVLAGCIPTAFVSTGGGAVALLRTTIVVLALTVGRRVAGGAGTTASTVVCGAGTFRATTRFVAPVSCCAGRLACHHFENAQTATPTKASKARTASSLKNGFGRAA